MFNYSYSEMHLFLRKAHTIEVITHKLHTHEEKTYVRLSYAFRLKRTYTEYHTVFTNLLSGSRWPDEHIRYITNILKCMFNKIAIFHVLECTFNKFSNMNNMWLCVTLVEKKAAAYSLFPRPLHTESGSTVVHITNESPANCTYAIWVKIDNTGKHVFQKILLHDMRNTRHACFTHT